jgi:hypothetical protein
MVYSGDDEEEDDDDGAGGRFVSLFISSGGVPFSYC